MHLPFIIVFICTLLITNCTLGQDNNNDTRPKPIQMADKTYEKAIDDANKAYDRAVTKAHTGYLEALEKAMTQETKAGHLETALAIRNILNAAKENGPPVIANLTKQGALGLADSEQANTAKIDWAQLLKSYAKIHVVNLEPVVLKESVDKNGWQRVPDVFKRYRTTIYMGIGKDNGVADFEVIKDGNLFLACNFDYQGNSSGDWIETRWTKEQFVNNGWIEISRNQLGGILVNNEGRQQVIFMKQVKRGEKYRLRCNKYEPPHVIVLSDK